MKSENFIKWEPVDDIPNGLYIDDIIDDHNGLAINFRGEDSDDFVTIQFGLFVISYQSIIESCVLRRLDDFSTPGSLFISEDSDYIDYLLKQSYGLSEGLNFHYVIKHADGIIDVVTSKPPEAKWNRVTT